MDIRKLTVSLFTACTLVASLIAPLGSGLNNFKSDHALNVEAAEVNNSLSGTPVLCTLVANSSNGDVVLQPNKKYYSPNADYYAKFQSDGHLAVYNKNDVLIWKSKEMNKTGNPGRTCKMQQDGNMVIYDKNNTWIWQSNTNEKRNASLYLSDKGELCIYSAKEGAYTFSSSGNPSDLVFHTLIANSSNADKEIQCAKSYYSQNRKYRAIYQNDGNLVVYDNTNNNAIWNSGTATYNMRRCVMQVDGNLVIYSKDNKAAWQSHTNEKRNASLYLSDEGELCIYSASKGAYTFLSHAIAISTSNTIVLDVDRKYYSPNANYYAKFQSDGNLVVYDKSNRWVWQSGTAYTGKTCKMQVDGNLVIYDAKNNPVWHSHTNEMRNAVLYLTDTGKLCIYSNDKKKCTFVSDYKISIPDSDITLQKQTMSKIECSLEPNSNGNKFSTGFTKLGQNNGLMLRRVTVSTTVTFSKNISESEIRKQLRFYVRYRFQDPVMQDVKEGGERWMREESDYFAIDKMADNKYTLTAKNIPCLGNEVDFGLVNNSNISISKTTNFDFGYTDKDFQKYDVLCRNGENIHITMQYNCTQENIETWLKTLSRYVNSLSNITGVKRNNIYIFEFADQLCICPCDDGYVIPANNPIHAVLVPSASWGPTYSDVQQSIQDSPDSIHLLYLHELGHCYATKKFNNTFNCNIDDGNTNARGITAMQNCTELNQTVLYANGNLGTYNVAFRNLADSKYGETVNFKILNMFANYIQEYGDKNGWAILEKYFEGGDQFFNANLYASNFERAVKEELKKSDDVNKNNCNNLCEESIKFINALQFLQQNAPNQMSVSTFVQDIINKDSQKHEYKDTLTEYMERIEKGYRGIKDHYLFFTKCVG